MQRTKHEQLAILCNVKPEIVVSYFSLWMLITRKPPVYKEVYPDFCEPKNALRLLGILHRYSKRLNTFADNMRTIDIREVIPIENAIDFCINEIQDTTKPAGDRKLLKQWIGDTYWEIPY